LSVQQRSPLKNRGENLKTKLNDKLYYSISEVAEQAGVKPYVLRFWEKEFPQLKPKKNRSGNRSYQQKDIDLISQIKHLLYEEGFTIEGAKSKLKELKQSEVGDAVAENMRLQNLLGEIRKEISALLELLS
jgi:DNA-binding transcriptional MerR regulator